MADADGGTGGGSYKKGELSGTQYPDVCHVAIYDNADLLNPKIITTDLISSPAGRFRSQYYQSVWADENGDVYVFSPSYGKTATSDLQRTTVNAGVVRIPKNADDFDDYYCDIEKLSNGYSFMRNWYISGSYFLMQMYDQKFAVSGSGSGSGSGHGGGNHVSRAGGGGGTTMTTLSLAIFDARNKTLTPVNLPDNVSAIGKTIYAHNGYVYIPVSFTDGYPVIYRIDPATGVAEKGLTVEVTSIEGIGLLNPVD